MDTEKTKKYLTVLEKIYSEQDGKILPLKRLKDIFIEMNTSPVMGTCLYRGLDFVEWDGESWRWIDEEKPTFEHAQKLHTFFLHYGVKGTTKEREEGKKCLKVLIKIKELLNEKYVKSPVLASFLTKNRVKFSITTLQKHNFIFVMKYSKGGGVIKWLHEDELTLQDGVDIYRASVKHLKKRKQDIILTEKKIVRDNIGIESYIEFMEDLMKILYKNKQHIGMGIQPHPLNIEKLCEKYNVSTSIIYVLEKTSTFGWLKKIKDSYVWDHKGCTKKDIEKIYRSVTFYDNKPKLGSPKPIVVTVDEDDEE
jgi:hypothetical protein